jgi:hypothetical protein
LVLVVRGKDTTASAAPERWHDKGD